MISTAIAYTLPGGHEEIQVPTYFWLLVDPKTLNPTFWLLVWAFK